MNILAIGDVHGCYHTFKSLVEHQWKPAEEILIQVGDLINKGPHSNKTLRYVFKLQKKFPGRVVFLKGNHEWFLSNYFRKYSAPHDSAPFKTSVKAHKLNITEEKLLNWIEEMPLYWQNEKLLISHAGVQQPKFLNPALQADTDGLLHNRKRLKFQAKMQITGHIVQERIATFYPKENCWRIDTGAWLGRHLTALRLTPQGNLIEVLKEPTDPRDLVVKSKGSQWLPIMELYSDI